MFFKVFRTQSLVPVVSFLAPPSLGSFLVGAMERFAGVDAAGVSGVQPSNSGAGGAPLGAGCERKAAIVFKPSRTGEI